MKKITSLLLLLPFLFNAQVQIGQDINGTDIDRLGASVAISSDGTIVVVGADFGDGTLFNSGYVRVFENINNDWIQLGNDINGLELSGLLGWSVDVSSDGLTIVIGALNESGTSQDSGVVKVYQFQNNDWVQLGSEINGDNQSNRLGYSIDLSSDGSIVAIGAPFGINPGVKIFEFQGNDWVLLGDFIPDPSGLEQFGHDLALSADGETIAIGVPGNNDNGNNSGRISIYKFESNTWQQQGNSIIGQAQDDNFGWSTTLSADGNIVAGGSYQSDVNGLDSGQARAFKIENNIWTQIGNDINGDV